MPTQNTSANQVFAHLAKALDYQTGFGLCFLFSDDIVGLNWLGKRLEEHVKTNSKLRETTVVKSFFNFENLGATVLAMCAGSDKHTVVWCHLPINGSKCRAVLVRLNEQRQRLIGSGHFFVLGLPNPLQHEAPAWAPDLWSVRNLTYQWQRSGGGVSRFEGGEWNAASGFNNTDQAHTTVAMQTWQRIYQAWLEDPKASLPSSEVGLLASEQAQKLGQFSLAIQFSEEALKVATKSGLGRANALQSLGDLKRRLGQVDEAQALHLQAIGLYEKEQADLGRANALKSLGDRKSRLGQVDEAQALYLQAIGLYEKEQDDLGRANALQSLGDLKSRLGQVDEAQALYLQAIGLYEKESDSTGQAYAWAELASLWRNQAGANTKMLDAAQKARMFAMQCGSPVVLKQVREMLAKIPALVEDAEPSPIP